MVEMDSPDGSSLDGQDQDVDCWVVLERLEASESFGVACSPVDLAIADALLVEEL